MTQTIAFEGLKHAHAEPDEGPIDFSLTGWPADEIGDDTCAGQVTLNISGKDEAGACSFDTVVDLQLLQAKAVAAAILALVDYVEQADTKVSRVGQHITKLADDQ